MKTIPFTSNTSTKQLTLAIDRPFVNRLQTFIPSQKTASLKTLTTLLRDQESAFIHLYGMPGCGKSHLLQASCHEYYHYGRHATYWPLKKIHHLSCDILEGSANSHLVCIDDVDTILGQPDWEASLLQLFHEVNQNKHTLILSSQIHPHWLTSENSDLINRFQSQLALSIPLMNQSERMEAVKKRLQHAGIHLNNETLSYIIKYFPSDHHQLFQALEHTTRKSLEQKRKITVSFLTNNRNIYCT